VARTSAVFLVSCSTIISLLLLPSPFSVAAETTVSSISANLAQFDGKSVTVRGIPTTVKPTVSQRGNAYTTLLLQDGGSALTVYTRGHPSTANGDRVDITEVFQTIKRVGSYTFYNKLEAFRITPRHTEVCTVALLFLLN